MKNLTKIAFILTAVLLTASCTDSKKKEYDKRRSEYIRPASINFVHEDSMQINALVNSYIECLKNRNFESAATMLYTYRNDSIFPLDKAMQESLIKFYNTMPIYDAGIKSFLLNGPNKNRIQLSLQIVRNGDITKDKGVSHLSLNPVKIGNEWYLTLLDNDALRVDEFRK